MDKPICLSIEAMGGDTAPDTVIEGLDLFHRRRSDIQFLIHGDAARIEPLLANRSALAGVCEIHHADKFVRMEDKPAQILRRARGTSMWNAIDAVSTGAAHAAVSAGNTGALMAISMSVLRRMKGVKRPGMTALWPTLKGMTVVLDVGANIEADAEQLVKFAIMGEAYARAVTGIARPSIGLLNIGSEDVKGHDDLKRAAESLSDPKLGLNYHGFIEGDDISTGMVDVVVTDGFTGNVALKTAEGTARLVGAYVREALTGSALSKLGAALAFSGLRHLRHQMNPSRVNGGVLLGLNGVVVKSHGGADADGFATAINLAADLARSQYAEEVSSGLARFTELGKDQLAAEGLSH